MTKLIAKILLLVILLGSCFAFVGCSYLFRPRWFKMNTKFSVTIEEVSGWNHIDFQIGCSYHITVKPLIGSDDITLDEVQIEYNSENAVITSSGESRGYAYFYLYCYEFGSNDKLKITYAGKTIEVDYSVVDYDFEAHDYESISSINDLDKYPEIKDMILSIEYHEFEEPYIGLDETWRYNEYKYVYYDPSNVCASYNKSCSIDSSDPNYIAVDYLPYLMDSVYYPAKFNTVIKNRVSDLYLNMRFPLDTYTGEGASRTKMNEFSISYHVIDPCCTANYPLTSMGFSAESIDLLKVYSKSGETYPTSISILLERYPEKFFQYKLGELTIYILCKKETGASAYFFDETYFYSISGYYDQEYK